MTGQCGGDLLMAQANPAVPEPSDFKCHPDKHQALHLQGSDDLTEKSHDVKEGWIGGARCGYPPGPSLDMY